MEIYSADRAVTNTGTIQMKILTMPMHFFRMLQMLKSFRENIGAGKRVLMYRQAQETQVNKASLHYVQCVKSTGIPDNCLHIYTAFSQFPRF